MILDEKGKPRPVETTVKRIAYFGFVMTNREARQFGEDNSYW
jgi:hypothetical protein